MLRPGPGDTAREQVTEHKDHDRGGDDQEQEPGQAEPPDQHARKDGPDRVPEISPDYEV